MKKILLFSIFMAGFVSYAGAVVPSQRRGQSASEDINTSVVANDTMSARSAVRSSVVRSGTTPAVRTISARSGVTPTPTVVSARAATTQKVIGLGTKISSANKNIVVDETCKQKYDGCMDSFCMIENSNGGRCICSDRKAELDDILTQIQRLDAQSYKMATEGVERIEMGADADAAIAAANNSAKSILNDNNGTVSAKRKKTLDLALWDQTETPDTSDDLFAAQQINSLEGKTGDALYGSVAQICSAQIPECKSDLSMIQMIYAQNIKSDCSAYENDLNKQKNASSQKLASAEKALRDAALDSLHAANKYDLGQCTIEFKKCMSGTAGCKDDFTGCVGIAAAENAKMSGSSKSSMRTVDIKGSSTKISIAASTMDALESKKPMCQSITNSCVAVADQVWNTFLREVAPTLKSAELLAESDLRTNCISNISSCFQKACKDTMDPNDPDGSYDMCLSRPETVKSLCRVQIDPCISAEPLILDFVYARLSGMRVDSCTTEVKECLQSDDRCGADYSNCVGLDTDTIIRMCPYDKLVGCQKVYSSEKVGKSIRDDAVYDELATMVQGIMLNIDNNMLTQCQKAADEAMVKVCGGTEECNGLTVDENTGSKSLEYKICQYDNSTANTSINYNQCRTNVTTITDAELRSSIPFAGILDGTIYWENIDFDDSGRVKTVDDYISKTGNSLSESEKVKVQSELVSLQKSIDAAINTIEADPTVQYCMTGRQVQGMKDMKIGRADSARFPELTKQMRMTIAQYALQAAKKNYYKKYDELSKRILEDYKTMSDRVVEIDKQNTLDARRDAGRKACINMAGITVLRKFFMLDSVANSSSASSSSGSTLINLANGWAMPFATVSSTGKGIIYTADELAKLRMIGTRQTSTLREKEAITTTYNWETLNCHKCVKEQTCSNVKNPLFSSKYCSSWGAEKETCTDTQF